MKRISVKDPNVDMYFNKEKITGIYAIISSDGRMYIGKSVDVHKRWEAHKSMLKKGSFTHRQLGFLAEKYGLESLIFVILEECAHSELDARERHYIKKFRPFFNAKVNKHIGPNTIYNIA